MSDGRRARRDSLIDLTVGLIAERGVEACTFRNLADLNGTTTRPFTYEFGSRADLLAAVAKETWHRLGFAPGEEPVPGDDPLDALYRLCTRAVPVSGLDEPAAMRVYAAILMHSAEDTRLREALAEANEEGVGPYLALIRGAQARGQVAAGLDPDDLIASIWALGDGLILAAITHPDHFTPERIERVWRQGFDALAGSA